MLHRYTHYFYSVLGAKYTFPSWCVPTLPYNTRKNTVEMTINNEFFSCSYFFVDLTFSVYVLNAMRLFVGAISALVWCDNLTTTVQL